MNNDSNAACKKIKFSVHLITYTRCSCNDCCIYYRTKLEMLKKKFRHLNRPEVIDQSDLSSEEKEMLKHFLRHIDHVQNRPSVNDLNTVAEAYYQGT